MKRHPVRGLVAAMLIAVVSVSCSDDPQTPRGPTVAVPNFDFLDASNGGPEGIFFLPPLVSNPNAMGVFDGDLIPTVEICGFNGPISCFTWIRNALGTNKEGGYVEQPAGSELYQVNWKTSLYNVPNNATLRIQVRVFGEIKAYVDVQKTASGWRTTADGSLIPGGNSNIPIKFRLEESLLCGDSDTCTQQGVTPGEPTTIELPGLAILQFDGDEHDDPFNVKMEQVECALPTDFQQFQLCLRLEKDFEGEFNAGTTADLFSCLLDEEGFPYLEDDQLRVWVWSGRVGDPIREPPPADIQYADCSPFGAQASVSSPMLKLLGQVKNHILKPVAALIGPRELNAFMFSSGGLGTKLNTFSETAIVRPLRATKHSGDNQSGPVGTFLPDPVTVEVRTRYSSTETPVVAGYKVYFEAAPDGLAASPFALTGLTGLASTHWRLPTSAGPTTLEAELTSAANLAIAHPPYSTSVTFNAVARDLLVKWLPPLTGQSQVAGDFQSGLAPEVVVSIHLADEARTLVGVLTSFPAIETGGQYKAGWAVPALETDKVYRLTVQLDGPKAPSIDLQVVNNQLRNVTTGERVLNLANNRTLDVKFELRY